MWEKIESVEKIQGFQFLREEFFSHHTLEVARGLLGKVFIFKPSPQEMMAVRIVETEAYRADDPASHCARGFTPRSAVMFGKPGYTYVYFIYGKYEMLNFVTEPENNPGAVLIRAAEPLYGEQWMYQRRSMTQRIHLTNGPAKLCQALGIRLFHNCQSLQGPFFYIGDDGYQPSSISTSPRIGIRVGKEKLWRFYLSDHPFVSPIREKIRF